MKAVRLSYNPFLPELDVTVDKEPLSRFSSLRRLRHVRLLEWAPVLFDLLANEINDNFTLEVHSNSFCYGMMRILAARCPRCVAVDNDEPMFREGVLERLHRMESLSPASLENREFHIGLSEAAGMEGSCAALLELLVENDASCSFDGDAVSMSVCEAVSVRFHAQGETRPACHDDMTVLLASDELTEAFTCAGAPYNLVLIASDHSALVRGDENGMTMYTESDDIVPIVSGVIDDQLLCPMLSDAAWRSSRRAMAEDSDAFGRLCLIDASFHVDDMPDVMDVGRTYRPGIRSIPQGIVPSSMLLTSADPSVVAVDGDAFHPVRSGKTNIAVTVNSAVEPQYRRDVMVRSRLLVRGLTLFPSVKTMPVNGDGRFELSIIPADATNVDELRWSSDDPSVVRVDNGGKLHAVGFGNTSIRVFTAETETYARVEVRPVMRGVKVSADSVRVEAGSQIPWRFAAVPADACGADLLRAVSEDPAVAQYRGGYIVGVGVGETIIRISTSDGMVNRWIPVSVRRKGLFQ
ncbi:Ig-like domain-containing protein [Bifidobacterium jacchi]|uniref:BIG2 domain-containing protein n=1 Tax=Bifidobacterium jacchi TaxID=2490545 RepID=A0A5N5RE52_9BIFI|nr:Ig-like domain-containing protein [Bifidobacterium jacchi]KAB5604757.1 hypothetical protein EHS19_09795 [Bifidobacterium jacchi]